MGGPVRNKSLNKHGLTQKQESFCHAYIETGSASEAYRRAYDCLGGKKETIHRGAKTIFDTPKVLARIEQLREEHMARHNITVDDLIDELEEARVAALTAETVQASAATGATMGKAKLLGLDKQIIDHQSSDGTMSPKPAIEVKKEDLEAVLKEI